MPKYTSVIIDDEIKLREVLKNKLERYCPDIELVGQAEDALSGYHLIQTKKPQIVFLDISMPLLTGFEMLERFETIHFEVIFVTGYDQYALDALKISAVDYLLKPLKTSDLQQAVLKAIDRISKNQILERFDLLKHNLKNVGSQSAKIALPGMEAYELITVSEIIRCEGWQKYTKILLANGKKLISSYNIGVFKDLLKTYPFYSTHKSHLINKSHILRYLKEGIVVMSDDSQVPVARRRKEHFLQNVIKNQ